MTNVFIGEELREIELKRLEINPNQPRKEFSLDELKELAASIEQIGLIHPPVVRDLGNNSYALIAGERRLRALKMLGKKKACVIIRHTDDEHSASSALAENLQRVDLNPIEIAHALHRLSDRFKLTQEELALRVGKKRSTVANYLRLLQLSDKIQQEVSLGNLSMGHAKTTLALPPHAQLDFVKAIQKNGWSVRLAEQQAKKWTKPFYKKKLKKDPIIDRLKTQLEHRFNSEVTIVHKQGRGSVTFQYQTLDDLDRLLTLWNIHED